MKTETIAGTIERSGVVLSCAAGVARIRLDPPAGCAGCAGRGTCASSAGKPQIVEMRLPADIDRGTRVLLTLPESSVAKASLLGYLLPAVGLVLGASLGAWFFSGDLPAVAGAILGLAAGLSCVRTIAGRLAAPSLTPGVCASSSLPFPGDPS